MGKTAARRNRGRKRNAWRCLARWQIKDMMRFAQEYYGLPEPDAKTVNRYRKQIERELKENPGPESW